MLDFMNRESIRIPERKPRPNIYQRHLIKERAKEKRKNRDILIHQSTFEAATKVKKARELSAKQRKSVVIEETSPDSTALLDQKLFKGLSKKMTRGASQARYGQLKKNVVIDDRK